MKLFAQAALLGLIAALGLAPGRAADEKGGVTAKAILERYAKAIGGKEAFARHSSQHVTGTMEMPAQKMSGKMEVFAARPNKLVMKVAIPGIGEVTTGYNGEVGWMSTAITGPMLIEGKMAQQVATQADFNHSLHDPADYTTLELLGKEEFNGEECYKLKLVHRSGFESTEFFSVKSGLQKGFIATQETQFGPVAATTIVTDYKQFGDLYMPSKTIQKASGIETVMTIEKMEYDNVPASVFDLPAEVKTLLEQKKKGAVEPANQSPGAARKN